MPGTTRVPEAEDSLLPSLLQRGRHGGDADDIRWLGPAGVLRRNLGVRVTSAIRSARTSFVDLAVEMVNGSMFFYLGTATRTILLSLDTTPSCGCSGRLDRADAGPALRIQA